MQPFPATLHTKQKLNQSTNPLKQLFSQNLSPKHKPSEPARQKPFSTTPVIELGNKYAYSYEDLIGDGFTSKVYKGYDIEKQSKSYAIKVIQKSRLSSDQMKLIRNEIDLHPRLQHRGVVKCYDIFDTPKFIYIVLQLCQHGDLAQYLQAFRDKDVPQYRAIQLMEQIIDGYRYLVQQGILHRDLKPQNILRTGNSLKIADFGFAIKGKKTLIDSMNVGTPLYMPPQAIEQCVYSHKSDFFALGVIMYQILHGKTPWYKNDQKALALSMRNGRMDLSRIKNPNIKYFIEKTCAISEGHRMSVDQFMQFDFRQTNLIIQITPVNSQNNTKPHKAKSQKTDRTIVIKQPAIISPDFTDFTGVRSTRSKKSQTAMQATFVSNHIYFKSAKCQQIKKITADFEQKFELCLLLKYLIQNSEQFLLLEEFDRKNLRIVLFRHCIFILKKLINEFARTKTFDLKSWLQYKEGSEFRMFEYECKTIKQKMQKQFNLQLKGMSLKNLSEVNKKFPELTTQYQLPKVFYQKLKQYLRQLIRKFHQQLMKKMVRRSPNLLFSPLTPNPNSGYFQAFKSLHRYHQSCDQKLCEQDINKSLAYYTTTTNAKNQSTVKTSNTKTTTTQNSSNLSANLHPIGGIKEFFFSKPFSNNDEMPFGKQTIINGHQNHFNHLSPEHDNSKVAMNSPRSKYLLNKTAGKNCFNQIGTQQDSRKQMKGSQFVDQNTSKPHHYYAYGANSCESQAQTNVDSIFVSVYSPTKKLLSQKTQNPKTSESVQSFFGQVLCKNYAQSKATKEEFIAIKKKIKWLW